MIGFADYDISTSIWFPTLKSLIVGSVCSTIQNLNGRSEIKHGTPFNVHPPPRHVSSA